MKHICIVVQNGQYYVYTEKDDGRRLRISSKLAKELLAAGAPLCRN
ncbi:hypothetical protein [Priestia taiwanensis]|nr:hypothetical protein [Priestia taiwanensis]MBM7361914.1 hypothetical protein [Priestia taiwanensis]